MINNRQGGGGRRRGRGGGGQRSPGGGGGQGQRDSGNRIDSRARGNAAQLLEKYRNMARDAQLSGDRVNTEYYLQFADHYFRVLADQRGRFEEQNQSRDRRPRDDFDLDDDFGDDIDPIRADEQPRDDNRREAREERNGHDRRDDRRDDNRRDDRRDERRFNRRDDNRRPVEAEPAPAPIAAEPEAADAAEAPKPRRGRPRRVAAPEGSDAIADRLPPALAVPAEGVIASEGEPIEAPKPRTRRRRAADAEASAS